MDLAELQITFVVPAYNSQATIDRTIKSILRQTDDRYKIIIINDGSTDNTESICKSYEKQYPQKITYLLQENRGLGGARNRGLELTQTQYVSFLDSDDWIMPQYVENILCTLEKNTDGLPEIIMTLPQVYNENSKIVTEWYDKKLFEEIFTNDGQCVNPQTDARILQTDVNQCRKLLNMDFVRKTCFRFREHVKWEDVCPHFYLLSKCQCCMGIRSTGFYYRKGNNSQITASRGADRLDLIIVFDELLQILKSPGINKVSRMHLRKAAVQLMISFAREGIRMADENTRKKLVIELNRIFRKIPKSWYGSINASYREKLRYRLFWAGIRNRIFCKWFFDYIYQYATEEFVKKFIKVLKKKEKMHGTA